MTRRIATAAALIAVPPAPALADTGVAAAGEASGEAIRKAVEFHAPSRNVMPPIAESRRTGEGVGATTVNVRAGVSASASSPTSRRSARSPLRSRTARCRWRTTAARFA